jgi:hypothetical protein
VDICVPLESPHVVKLALPPTVPAFTPPRYAGWVKVNVKSQYFAHFAQPQTSKDDVIATMVVSSDRDPISRGILRVTSVATTSSARYSIGSVWHQ